MRYRLDRTTNHVSPEPLALVLGTNEIASAVAVHLVAEGHSVILSHDPFPPVIRRSMAFHDALFGDRAMVEGIEGECAETGREIARVLAREARVAVTPLHLTDLIALRIPQVLVDARMQKHLVTPDLRGIARLSVGLGPNFTVGVNCDLAVETRPARPGVILTRGETDAADGVAPHLGGVGRERFVYSHHRGPLAHADRDRHARLQGLCHRHSLDGRCSVAAGKCGMLSCDRPPCDNSCRKLSDRMAFRSLIAATPSPTRPRS